MNNAAGLEYEETGHGAPIICLHGIGGNTSSFAPQLSGLPGHRVIAVNLPGYGGSEAVEHPTFPKLAARITAFMDALDLSAAHLCGQSIGGMIALEAACLYPDRVTSLALIGTTSAFGGRDDSFKNAFIAARLKPLDAGETLATLAPQFVPDITGPDVTPAARESAVASMAAVPEATYRSIIRCLVTFNRREDISGLAKPICLIAGEHDTNAPAKTMARMAEKMPNAEYHLVKGAGHLINLEKGAETNAILNTFYEGLP
ncbi:MAG: alpha/beta hydrolase [Pseudomonadota bacterium]